MWFMFRANPVIATSVTWLMRSITKAHLTRKWSGRPIYRLPGSFGYHENRAM
jgi:hypothetical protein